MRKASITISLSWLFMIIVGTFFLILSYNIIAKYQDNEESKFELELKQTLRNIFNNVGRTTGIEENSLEPIGNIFSDSSVDILCVDDLPILSIDGNLDPNNDYLQNYPVFMTNIRQGKVDQTYMAVESYRLPFKISNMLALVSKKNLIVIDSESEIGEELIDKFRRTSYGDLNYISEDFSDLSTFQSEVEELNLNSVVFVTDNSRTLSIPIDSLDYETYLVQVRRDSPNYGEIRYTNEEQESQTFTYIDYNEDLSLVTMSLFSGDENFGCSYNKILDSVPAVYQFYIEKARYLKEKAKSEKVCSSTLLNDANGSPSYSQQEFLYSDVEMQLVLLKEQLENENFNNPLATISLLRVLEDKNLVLEQYNCQSVY